MIKMTEKYIETPNLHNIKTLPVPNLEKTKNQFLKQIEPLARINGWSMIDIIKESKEFMVSPEIKNAHEFLKMKSQNKNISYLSDWWYESYINYQGMNLGVGAAITWGNKETQGWTKVERAAFILWSITKFYLELKKNPTKWQILETPKGKISLDQLLGMFSAYRKMEKNGDRYIINESIATNSLFMIKNHIFSIETVHKGEVASLGSIKNSIQEIVNNTKKSKIINANILSLSNDRSTDSAILNNLISTNEKEYKQVQNSIVVLNFDQTNFEDETKVIQSAFSGDEDINRWFGKPLNISVNNTYHSAITMEHSYFDGASFLVVLDFIDKNIKNIDFTCNNNVPYFELNFKFTNEQLNGLNKILQEFKVISKSVSFQAIKTTFGAIELKKIGIKSLDAFLQLCGQLAQQKTFGTFYSTYEAVDMRKYFKGRTECVRPLSNSILSFSKHYFGNKSFDIKKLFSDVENEHYQKVKDAKIGEGVQRHFLGLQMAHNALNNKTKLPLIDSKYYKNFASNRMSTSTIPYATITQFAFWPVQSDGFTMGYKIDKNHIFINSTSMVDNKEQLKKYQSNLLEILIDLYKKLAE